MVASQVNIDGISYVPALTTLTYGSTINTDCSLGNGFTVTLANTTAQLANPTNMHAGMVLTWLVLQDGTGGRLLTYGSAFKWQQQTQPVLSSGANAVDMISGFCNGTNIYAAFVSNFG
jgi:hypothetical protein